MHFHDKEKSSGGFIHGFRYLIKFFYECNFTKSFETLKFEKKDLTTLSSFIHSRLSTTSSLYQMYGILIDAIIYNEGVLKYVKDVTLTYCFKNFKNSFIAISLKYGDAEYDIRNIGIATDRTNPQFLHIEFDLHSFKNEKFSLVTKLKVEEDNFGDFSSEFYLKRIKSCIFFLFANL
jgi:hypothetical protein